MKKELENKDHRESKGKNICEGKLHLTPTQFMSLIGDH